MRVRNFIAGKWTDAARVAEDRDPADARTVVAEIADSGPAEVASAVAAAKAALPAWRAIPAPLRGRALERAADAMERELPSLAETLTRDEGKTLAESKAELARTVEAFRFCGGEASRIAGQTLPSERPGRLVMTLREPYGVAALITPFNYPAQLAAWKIGPALAAGNTAVFKPSEWTPVISARLVEILAAALDAPAGTLNMVVGAGIAPGEALVAHPDIALVSFTGSTGGGAAVRRAAAERGAPVLSEMGGKNPLVVLDDADLDLAVAATVRGAFGNAGQRCTATSRVIVLPSIAKRFTEAVVERSRALKTGSGLAPGVDVGPMISARVRGAVEDAVAEAIAGGAKALCGGKRPAGLDHGFFYEPTVLEGAKPDSRLAQTELFGPVLLLLPAKDDAEALAIANGTKYGLSASVYTKDLDRALRFSSGFEAGIVHVNSPTVGGESHVPFGGMKATANGGRERGSASVDFFTRWKTVYLDQG